MKTKSKIWLLAVAALVAILVVLGGIKVLQIRTLMAAGKNFSPPPESVTTAQVQKESWEGTQKAAATLVAVRAVMLASELPGTVRQIGFDSGASVKKGDVLVKLDTSTEEAQLAAAEADAALAREQQTRARNLQKGGANTPADVEAAEARAASANANVASLQATIAKKTIHAPFDGRVAIRQVELGQVVSQGTPIASLQSVSPIYADFWMPQQALAELRVKQRVRLRVDTFSGSTWDGEVVTVNPEVDVTTRNVRVRASFINADGRLRPGMYGTVEVISSTKRDVLTIPVTSVIYAPYGDSVFTIEKGEGDKETAKQRFVRLGEQRGDFVEVTSGLQKGETVVSNGAFKLRSGTAVAVNNALAPKNELAPQPENK